MRCRLRLSIAAAVAAVTVSACAATPPPPPPPPTGPAGQPGPVLRDWRTIITRTDRDRYNRRDAAWTLALQQVRRLPGSGDLSGLGALIDPDAARAGVPPVGDYRCRTVKLGSQGGEAGLGYVVYDWFACRIEATPAGLKFSKLTGSQRPGGLLFTESGDHMVMLGSVALAAEPPANSYGQRPDRDLVAVLERIGERRWRLVIPWPQNESNLDLIELVPN
tara:strand:- start:1838 stop:2497 length:660 start_codon:yes stop_codon:yes gene_type:complete